MRRAPAEAAGEDLRGIFVVGGLRGGVFREHGCEGVEVFEEVGVGEVAGLEVCEEGGKADGCGDGEKGGAVGGGGEEVQEGG